MEWHNFSSNYNNQRQQNQKSEQATGRNNRGGRTSTNNPNLDRFGTYGSGTANNNDNGSLDPKKINHDHRIIPRASSGGLMSDRGSMLRSPLPSLTNQRRNNSTGGTTTSSASSSSLYHHHQTMTSSHHYEMSQHPRGPLHLEGPSSIHSSIHNNIGYNYRDHDQQQQQQVKRPSSMIPIWALHSKVTSTLIDHSTRATGVSTSAPPPTTTLYNASSPSVNNPNIGSTMQMQSHHAHNYSPPSSAGSSSIHAASSSGVSALRRTNNESSAPASSAAARSQHGTSSSFMNHETSAAGGSRSRVAADTISKYSGGTKTWIRSGNKWIITNNNNNNNSNKFAAGIGISSLSGTGGASGGSRRYMNQNVKIDPTAVSSYGTTRSYHHSSSSSSNNNRGHHQSQAQSQAQSPQDPLSSSSAIPSFGGLYTRQRLTTTPGGFPYMPALHLVRTTRNNFSSGAVPDEGGSSGGGGMGISGGTGIARSDGAYADPQRFQSSYLLNAKPVSSPLANKNLLSEDDDDDDYGAKVQRSSKANGGDIGGVSGGSGDRRSASGRLIKPTTVISSSSIIRGSHHNTYSDGFSGGRGEIQRQSSSGYDSEREERLKEWKEKFVQKFIPSGDATIISAAKSNTTIRRSRSLDSDCDSETNAQNSRLSDWKEEQYRVSANSKVMKGSVGAGSFLTPPARQQSKGFSYSFTTSNNINSIGRSRRPATAPPEDYRDRIRSESMDSTDNEGYDSDAVRRRRVREWKAQFAHVEYPDINSPPPKPKRIDSSDDTEHLETIQLPTIKHSRRGRGREVPGRGIFPITSPPRNKNQVPPQNPSSAVPSSRRMVDSSSAASRGSTRASGHASLPPLTPPRIVNTIDKEAVQKSIRGQGGSFDQSDNAEIDGFGTKQQQEDSPQVVHEEEESQVVKAARFFLGLSSGDEPPSVDCLLGSAFEMASPCKILPSLSVDNASELFPDKALPVKNIPSGLPDRSTPLPLVQRRRGFSPIVDTNFNSSQVNLPNWDNCLYVKAEGARSGRIFLTKSHLIFIYDDELSDSLLSRYGWNREQIETLLLENEVMSRGATPVNVSLDESGEGGGVELIESDCKQINVMDLLEDILTQSETHALSTNDKGRERSLDKSEVIKHKDHNFFSETNTKPKDVTCPPTNVQHRVVDNQCSNYSELRSPLSPDDNRRHDFVDELPPISLSSSSLDSVVDYQQMNVRDANEEVLSQCIISAINEEAHMRLQEDERTMELTDTSNHSYGQQEYRSLHGNHTNVSSFSDVDMEIDPDQERSLYISGDFEAKRKYIGLKWPLSKLAEIFNRRYMMKEVGLEIYAPSSSQVTSSSLRQGGLESALKSGANATDEIDVPLGPLSQFSIFLVIPEYDGKNTPTFRRQAPTRRDSFVEVLKERSSNLNDAHWGGSPRIQTKWQWRKNDKTYALSVLTRAWRKGYISNLNYLLRLNAISGRSFHDPGNYPVMPWVLSNFTSDSVPDLSDERNYRDLSKPMGALDPLRLRKFQEKYAGLCASLDTAIPPFMYGSHYSNTGGVVLHYLVRTRPFAGLHRQLQGGQFDLPDRLFRSVAQTWDMCSRTSATEVKELTPEWYCDPSFLENCHGFNLGTSADGAVVSDVILPPWANRDPNKFVEVMQNALESDYCSANLPSWIDLIFGSKQRGPEAEKADNVFYHLTYYDSEDLANIQDDSLRTEMELHIVDFGSCPAQLFHQAHPLKKSDRKIQSELLLVKAMS